MNNFDARVVIGNICNVIENMVGDFKLKA